jgi:hypothetical protein
VALLKVLKTGKSMLILPQQALISGRRGTLIALRTLLEVHYERSPQCSAVQCLMDRIDQIGGCRSVATIGVGYGKGYSIDAIRVVMIKIQI